MLPNRPLFFLHPHPYPLTSPSDTLVCENLPGEGIASEWHATGLCPEPLNLHEEDVSEAGVPSAPDNSPAFPEDIVSFGLSGVAEPADAWKVEPSGVDARARALLVVGAALALAEGTASIKPTSGAERPPSSSGRKGRQGMDREHHRKARPGADSRRRRGKTCVCTSCRGLRHCRRRPSTNQRGSGSPENVSASGPEQGDNGKGRLRCHHKRGNLSPVGRRGSCRARKPHLLGKDQALGTQEGSRLGKDISIRFEEAC